MTRFMPLVILVGIAGIIYGLDLHTYLSFDQLKENRVFLQNFVANNFTLALSLAALAYVVVVALSLPGGAVMSVTAGFLFGSLWGTGLVVVAATVGATILFLVAQTALGESLKEKAGPWAQKMQQGFQENAFNYLLFLRLVPLFPFFIVNIVPAFLGVRLREYILATGVGIIPGSFVFVSVGTGIGSVFDRGETFSPGAVLTPEIIIALCGLAVLAVVPVLYKKFKQRS